MLDDVPKTTSERLIEMLDASGIPAAVAARRRHEEILAEFCGGGLRMAVEIDRLRAERGRLRAVLRVNLLRHVPGVTHAQIDVLLAGEDVSVES